MKFLNSVTLSVFSRQSEEDSVAVKKALEALAPLNLSEAKLAVKEEKATGFNEQRISIFSLTLVKESHTNAFLKQMLNRLTDEQKDLLARQRESRLDKELFFFIRFDKKNWLADRELAITDSGDCFHVKMHLAAYPARRPDALVLVEKIFKPD